MKTVIPQILFYAVIIAILPASKCLFLGSTGDICVEVEKLNLNVCALQISE